MLQLHFLPGDSLVEHFRESGISGEIAVCRECLIEGDLMATDREEFWQVREEYLSSAYPPEDRNFYREHVVREFEKLQTADAGEINLWFEHELFCQVNLWFCLDLLRDTTADIYRITPLVKEKSDIWKGFGRLATGELRMCFEQRERFGQSDMLLGADLWNAYQKRDFQQLRKLSDMESKCFPYLREVGQAAVEQEHRPQATLAKIMATDDSGFGKVFQKFNEIEAVYGFGDLQVRRLYDQLH